jgi:hypothetical protein
MSTISKYAKARQVVTNRAGLRGANGAGEILSARLREPRRSPPFVAAWGGSEMTDLTPEYGQDADEYLPEEVVDAIEWGKLAVRAVRLWQAQHPLAGGRRGTGAQGPAFRAHRYVSLRQERRGRDGAGLRPARDARRTACDRGGKASGRYASCCHCDRVASGSRSSHRV